MRFVLVSTEDSSKIPVDIPEEIMTTEKIKTLKAPPKKTRKAINKTKKIRKTINKTKANKIRKAINKAKSTQRSKSIIPKHGSVHHRN